MSLIANAPTTPSLDSSDMPKTRPLAEVLIQGREPPATLPQREELPAALMPTGRLQVIRGLRLSVDFPLYEGANLIGRRDDRPVDVDVTGLEAAERTWSSRQHAIITVTDGQMTIEDLNSMNGTFVNRNRVNPGEKRSLRFDDVVQIGTIQFKVIP
jgi:hypothetical protein